VDAGAGAGAGAGAATDDDARKPATGARRGTHRASDAALAARHKPARSISASRLARETQAGELRRREN
jgi:hypothetical protein